MTQKALAEKTGMPQRHISPQNIDLRPKSSPVFDLNRWQLGIQLGPTPSHNIKSPVGLIVIVGFISATFSAWLLYNG